MRRLIIFLLALFISVPAHAVTYCKRFPTDTAVACYGPDYPPPGGNGSINAQDDGVGIGTFTTLNLGTNISGSITNNVLTATGSAGGSSQWLTTNVGIGTYDKVGIGTITPNASLVVASGNVGIGSVNPTSALCVGSTCQGKITSAGAVTSVGVTNTGSAITNDNSYTQSGASTNVMTGKTYLAQGGGNVGIGTTDPLIFTLDAVGSGGMRIRGNATAPRLHLYDYEAAGSTLGSIGTVDFRGSTTASVASVGFGYSRINTSVLKNTDALEESSMDFRTCHGGGACDLSAVDFLIYKGNLGIGTTAPGTAFDFSATTRQVGTNIRYFGSDNTAWESPTAATNPGFRWVTGVAENMRLTNGGNLGLGSTDPGAKLDITGRMRQSIAPGLCSAGNYPLGVDGSLNAVSCTAAGGGSSQWITYGQAGNVGIGTKDTVGIGTTLGSAGLSIMNGNVGIGTWNPADKLDVIGSDTGIILTNSSAAMAGIINSNTTVNNFEDIAFGTNTSTGLIKIGAKISGVNVVHTNGSETMDMAFLTTNAGTSAEQMRIMGSGNVGIGTLSPDTRFQINARTSGVFINSSGNVGINTTLANNKLSVSGGVSIGDTYAGVVVPTGLLAVKTNVGIGTYAPQLALCVGSTCQGSISSAGAATTAGLSNGTTALTNSAAYTQSGSSVNLWTGNSSFSSNVGIGTTAAQAPLSVMSGNVGIGTYAPVALFQIGGTGNVGIGTTNPLGALVVFQGNVGINTIAPTSTMQFKGTCGAIGPVGTCWTATGQIGYCSGAANVCTTCTAC